MIDCFLLRFLPLVYKVLHIIIHLHKVIDKIINKVVVHFFEEYIICWHLYRSILKIEIYVKFFEESEISCFDFFVFWRLGRRLIIDELGDRHRVVMCHRVIFDRLHRVVLEADVQVCAFARLYLIIFFWIVNTKEPVDHIVHFLILFFKKFDEVTVAFLSIIFNFNG